MAKLLIAFTDKVVHLNAAVNPATATTNSQMGAQITMFG